MTRILIGAGGHAAVVYEIALQKAMGFDGFVDPFIHSFNHLKKMHEYDDFAEFFIGIGGASPDDLLKRHILYNTYKNKNYQSFRVISNQSYISPSAIVKNGTLISHHSIIQTNTVIGENCIINTGSIIEHDVIIEDGCHIAPGAIVLGGAKICSCTMIGAGAVVLANQIVPPQTLVPALRRYQNDR